MLKRVRTWRHGDNLVTEHAGVREHMEGSVHELLPAVVAAREVKGQHQPLVLLHMQAAHKWV